ncbi:MAG TPA: serine hydrolase domain-containing protein [Pyrinomonadaceae bacterium]|nr:serine hydrolase domain-containing protein [Pyrinomonadaceae bacterium]
MKSNHKLYIYALLTICFLLPLHAFADNVDDYIQAQMAEHHVPGVAVAVIDKGRVVKIKGYGVASLEFNVPVTDQTAFEIGSVSKQMTAAAIMLLVEEGKVNLDDPVSKYLQNTPDTWKTVTIRHLLTHSSGVKSYTSLEGFDLIKRMKVDDFIKKLASEPLEFTPGEKNIYSNSGFSILAYVIESASGKQYMDFMRERIFAPLGMKTCADRDPQFIIPNRATGYEWTGERYTGRSWDLTDLKGAGTIVCTISDMVNWDQALRGDKFLSPTSRKAIWTQFTFNNGQLSPYGFGWRISDVRGHKLIGHTGQTAGFAAANYRFVDDGIDIVVLTNQGDNGGGGNIALGVAKLYIPAISIKSMKEVPGGDAAMTALVGKAFTQRAENKPDTDVFSPELVRSLSTPRARTANTRIAAVGPIQSLTLVGIETAGSAKTFIYRATTAKGASLWRIVFTDDHKIREMTLDERE